MKKKKFISVLVSTVMVFSLMSTPIKVNAEGTVASIGDVKYESLMAAANGAKKGDTILLENDVVITPSTRLIMTGDKYDVTLDLNGHKISQTLDNGNINVTGATVRLDEGAKLTVKDSKSGGQIFGYQTPVLVLKNASFMLESGTLIGDWYGLSGNGKYQGTTINIKGGTILNQDPDGTGAAIYHPQTGHLRISGGMIKGDLGVQLCSGNATILEMSGGSIKGTGTDHRISKTGDGAITDGAAVSIVNRPGYSSIPKVTISGGEFTSVNSEAVLAYTWSKNTEGKLVATEWADAKNNVIIQGGSFNTTPETYVASTYKSYKVGEMFTVAPVTSKVELSSSVLELETGDSVQLTASLTPTTTLDTVEYISSDLEVATVDTTGKVIAASAGTATITAKAGDKIAICVVKVTHPAIKAPIIDITKPVEKPEIGVQDKESLDTVKDSVTSIVDEIKNGKDLSIETMSKDTAEKVKEALTAGKNIIPRVEAKTLDEKDLDKATLAKVNDLLADLDKVNGNESTVVQYLDLGVMLLADNAELGTLNKLDKPIEFTVALPKDLQKEGRKYYVIRIHDGVAEKLDATLNTNGTLTFRTDAFSTYALVYEEVISSTTPETPAENPDEKPSEIIPEPKPESKPEVKPETKPSKTPNTGDSNRTLIIAGILGVASVLVGVVALNKKRKYNK